MMLVPLLLFLGLVLALVSVAVVFFRRPAGSPHGDLAGLLSGRSARLRISEVRPFSAGGYVVLADITGYTRFLYSSRFSADHAQFLVLRLLEGVVEAAGSALAFVKIEGDAALFVSQRETGNPADIAEALHRILRGFYATRRALRESNACTCEACRSIDNLDLKVAVDRGPIQVYSVNGQLDVSGTTLIRAHRLLKLHAAEGPHLVMTREVQAQLPLAWAGPARPIEADLEGIGRTTLQACEIDPDALSADLRAAGQAGPAERWQRLGRLVATNAGKLRVNLRRLGI